MIFTDVPSLPWSSPAYWLAWLTPHVFFEAVGDSESVEWGLKGKARRPRTPPPGWLERRLGVSHCASGGATSGLWELVAWHPPGTHAAPVLPLTPRSWFPLRAFINDRVAARPLPAAAAPTDLPPVDAVVRAGGPRPRDGSRPGGHVSQWGLFPSTQLDATVLLTASGSPSGWGTRSLTPLELASLWDVPISVTDSLSSVDDHGVLLGFCDSAPAKVLFAGADSLLTTSFRGGSIALGTSQGSVETVPGPTPFSNEALGLASQPGGGESEGGGRNALACDALALEVIKGDHQKNDDAGVPDHLWALYFLRGYGQASTAAAHLRALGLNPQARTGYLLDKAPPGSEWKAALDVFRGFGLRWWNRNLVRGYLRWRRAHVKIHRGCTPSEMVRGRYAWTPKGPRAVFEWTTKGRASYKSQWSHLRSSADGLATVQAGLDAIRRAANASWFEWLDGSALFFWNWGDRYQRLVRDGQPHYVIGPFPVFLKPQKSHRDPMKHELMRKKVVQVRKRGYILPGKVVGGTHYFCVDKGLDDIRMVYNGTSCGLNEILWAPRFGLPTCRQTLRGLLPGHYQCDLDVGEQFLNYPLHKDLREFSGVDVSGVRSTDPADTEWERQRGTGVWERWERNWMGLRDSPYRSLQWQVRLKYEAYGDRRNRDNPFHWEKVLFNLPGSKGYRSDLPWVMKVRFDGNLAGEIFVYVDDGRVVGHDPALVWRAARAYAAACSRRGVQDAARKRTSPTMTPGPWAGTITHTDGGTLMGMVSQEKWTKTQGLIKELADMIPRGPLPLQRLLEIRGFLMYVVRTYTWLNPYVKGLHLTVDSWRDGRAEDGFKWTAKERREGRGVEMPCRRGDEGWEDQAASATQEDAKAPETVLPVARYLRDLECLQQLTAPKEPPRQLYRARHQAAFFVVGDASGKAKGSAVVEQYGVNYESGAWNLQWRMKSSNCREAENLTDRLERLVEEGALIDHEVFLITDNSAFEGAYYKGHSHSRELSDIVLRVHKAERDGGFVLHVVHISGKRMKASGVDGLSRGDLTEGMMAGRDPLAFVPFNEDADERSNGQVSAWVRSWWSTRKGSNFGGFNLERITPDNMFELRDMQAARLWILPPATMEVVMELLSEDRLAHPQWPHVFVVPRLMTHFWRKDLMKSADLLFTVPAGVPFWTDAQFEPLIVAVILPLSHVASYTGPWIVRGTPEGERTERALSIGFKGGDTDDSVELHDLEGGLCGLWEDAVGGSRTVLQQFLAWASNFPPVQKCMVRELLPGGKRRPFPQVGRQRGHRKRPRLGS